MAARSNWLASISSLVATLALAAVPLPNIVAPARPDWVAVVLLYWSLMAPRHFSLLTAFWMGIALDTLTGALLGQNALALLLIVYLAEKFHLQLRVFPLSQLAITVLRMRAENENPVHILRAQNMQEADVDRVVGIDLQQHATDLGDAGVGNIQIELLGQIILGQKGQNGFGLGNLDDIAPA